MQSRYYNPQVGRFINADALVSTGQGILGNNMFAYCLNNPVQYTDSYGQAATAYFDESRDRLNIFNDIERGGGGHQATYNDAVGYAVGAGLVLASATPSQSQNNRIYTVYFLYATGGNSSEIVYVGRVKTVNFDARMSYHANKGRSLSGFISNLNYAECRFVEQAGMIYHHTIRRGSPIYNQIRGISPTNPNAQSYIDAILDLISQRAYPNNILLPMAYIYNYAENEFLNAGIQ